MTRLPFLALIAVMLASACSSGDSGSTSTTTTSTGGTTASQSSTTAAATPTVPPAAQVTDLTLVYIDTRMPGQAQLWLAAHDGSQPKMLTSLPAGARALDLKDNLLLVSGGAGERYLVIDLKDGQTKTVTPSGTATDARLLNANTMLYTTRGACGPAATNGTLVSVDLTSMQQKTLLTINSQGMSILATDATAGLVTVAPRGCDVSTTETRIYRLSDGSLQQTIATPGCGWVAAALSPLKILASWKACTPPADKAGVDATLYDLTGINPAVPVARDLKAPSGGSNAQPWLLRPGKTEAALGTTSGTGPGTLSSGVWLLDLNTQAFTTLQPPTGAEQSPVAWSADGAYLLTMSVQAQGVCRYHYVDVATKKVPDVAADITVCGVNGQVAGWARLK